MTLRTSQLLLLAAAACASAPVSREPPANQPPLPRSSIVAVLAHRGELELSEEQATVLERADAELQVQLSRLRTEGVVAPPAEPRSGPPPESGPPPGSPGAGGPGGGRSPGMGMNMGPGGVQLTPGGGMGGGAGRAGMAPSGAAPAAPPRRDPARAQQAIEAKLDEADTRAFLKAEAALTPAQRERAREIAGAYREQLFERREQQRGR